MNLDLNEADRLRRAFAATCPEDAPRDDCPPAARIWDGLRGELTPPRIRELVDHLALCPACSEAWRLGRELENAPVARRRQPRRPGVFSGRPWLQGLAAAAAAIIVTVGLSIRDVAPPDLDRASSGLVLELLIDGPLPRQDCRLRWTDLGEATYDLDVATADLDFVDAAQDLVVPEYLVPPAAVADLPPGTRLKARVEAYGPDGSLLAAKTLEVELQ